MRLLGSVLVINSSGYNMECYLYSWTNVHHKHRRNFHQSKVRLHSILCPEELTTKIDPKRRTKSVKYMSCVQTQRYHRNVLQVHSKLHSICCLHTWCRYRRTWNVTTSLHIPTHISNCKLVRFSYVLNYNVKIFKKYCIMKQKLRWQSFYVTNGYSLVLWPLLTC